jgi:hypothetical protein
MKKRWAFPAALMAIAMIAGGQSLSDAHSSPQETQARGYWVDPITGLMWAAKDNGEDVNWHEAMHYCRDLRSAGFSDWKLATIDELEGIYERNAKSRGEIPRWGNIDDHFYTFDVKGKIFLTGDPWSGVQIDDGRGKPSENAWFLNFNEGSRIYDRLQLKLNKRALCARPISPTVAYAQSPAKDRDQLHETQVRGYWVDPSTGLMWASMDNGKDVSWRQAMKYCRDLRFAGFSDWRLPTLAELEGIYDKKTESPGENPRSRWHESEAMNFHVKGNLFITGDQWSSTQIPDDRGHPSGYEWYFDFNEGRSNNQPSGFPYSSSSMRALCVRNLVK